MLDLTIRSAGLGTKLEKSLMLSFLTELVEHFVNGPDEPNTSANSSTPFRPNPLIAIFSNDGQVNQLAAAIGVFDV